MPAYLSTHLPHDLLFISAVQRVSSEIMRYSEFDRTYGKKMSLKKLSQIQRETKSHNYVFACCSDQKPGNFKSNL